MFFSPYTKSNGQVFAQDKANQYISNNQCLQRPTITHEKSNENCNSGSDCGDFFAASSESKDDATASIEPGGGGGCNDACDPNQRMYCGSIGGQWSEWDCSCLPLNSPIVIDVVGDGFNLTDVAGGVFFDLNASGTPQQLSWTAAGSDDSWLALDRNSNGTIDSGAELFGNITPQPQPPAREHKNGFLALAEFDRAGGGNSDGMIDSRDPVYSLLRLWQDANHNGLSEAGELHTLAALSVASIALDYKESKRTDAYGNAFRYRAKVTDAKNGRIGRWEWDVFLTSAP